MNKLEDELVCAGIEEYDHNQDISNLDHNKNDLNN